MDDSSKKPVQVLRDRHGGISEQLKERFKEQNRIHKAIKEALKTGPLTIPELAQATKLPAEAVMWHTMALRRYGPVEAGEARGDYYTYLLKEEK